MGAVCIPYFTLFETLKHAFIKSINYHSINCVVANNCYTFLFFITTIATVREEMIQIFYFWEFTLYKGFKTCTRELIVDVKFKYEKELQQSRHDCE